MNSVTRHQRLNEGQWCQEIYATSSRDAGRRARTLRQAGYQVVSVMTIGSQIVSEGTIVISVVHVAPGENDNTWDLPDDDWTFAPFSKK